MWLRFHEPFDWRQPGFTIAYQAGLHNVTRKCAAAAIAAIRLYSSADVCLSLGFGHGNATLQASSAS